MTFPKPLRRINDDRVVDLVILFLALIGGIMFSLPLLLLTLFGYLSFRALGMTKPQNWNHFAVAAVLLTAILFIASKTTLGPLASLVGEQISSAQGLTDTIDFTDWKIYLLFLGVSVFTAGFLEEIVYRGYLLQRLAERLPLGLMSWPMAILISNVSFSLWHAHGGADSMVFSFLMGVLISLIFLITGRKLWLIIAAHSLYDVVVISLRFFQLDVPLPTVV